MDTQQETAEDITPWSLADRLRLHRARSGLTQQETANRAGLKRHRYSDFERGQVRPSQKELERVARVLGVNRSFLARNSDWNPIGPQIRRPRCTLHDRRGWRPVQDAPTAFRVKEALESYPQWVVRFLSQIRLRSDLPLVRRFLREVACDSKLEALVILALLALGAKPIWDTPLRAGFRQWPIVLRGRQAGDCRHPGLEHRFLDIHVVIFFQVSLQLRKGKIRPDCLVAVRQFGAATRWSIAEVDGPEHVEEKDRQRQLRHELPEVRVTYLDLQGEVHAGVLLLNRLLKRLDIATCPKTAEERRQRRSRKPRRVG